MTLVTLYLVIEIVMQIVSEQEIDQSGLSLLVMMQSGRAKTSMEKTARKGSRLYI